MKIRKDPISAIAISAAKGFLAEKGYQLVSVNDDRVALKYYEARYSIVKTNRPAPHGDNRGTSVITDVAQALRAAGLQVKLNGNLQIVADEQVLSFVSGN